MVSCSEQISIDLFNDPQKVDKLMESIQQNLFSQQEMVNLLEFINQHEQMIKGY